MNGSAGLPEPLICPPDTEPSGLSVAETTSRVLLQDDLSVLPFETNRSRVKMSHLLFHCFVLAVASIPLPCRGSNSAPPAQCVRVVGFPCVPLRAVAPSKGGQVRPVLKSHEPVRKTELTNTIANLSKIKIKINSKEVIIKKVLKICVSNVVKCPVLVLERANVDDHPPPDDLDRVFPRSPDWPRSQSALERFLQWLLPEGQGTGTIVDIKGSVAEE